MQDAAPLRQQRLDRFRIRLLHVGAETECRRDPPHPRQTQPAQQADQHPAAIEFEPALRELRRAGKRMVVVVQLLAAHDQPPRHQVGRGVGRLEIAVAAPVAEAVDDTGGPERDPRHLQRPDRDADHAEQAKADQRQQGRPRGRPARVEMAFDPVVGRADAVGRQVARIRGCLLVKIHAAPQDRTDAVHLRAVRVLGGLAFRVMLAVHGDPLPGHHARRQPAPETEDMRDGRMEIDAAVRLAAVQVQGDGGDRGLRHDHEVDQPGNPRCLGQSACRVGKQVRHGSLRSRPRRAEPHAFL